MSADGTERRQDLNLNVKYKQFLSPITSVLGIQKQFELRTAFEN